MFHQQRAASRVSLPPLGTPNPRPRASRSPWRAAVAGGPLLLALSMGTPVQAISSPSGTIVFASYPPGSFGINGTSDLFSIRPDGSGLRRVTDTADLDEQQPALSADGSKLVYRVSDRRLNFRISSFELYTSDADGGQVTRITNDSWAEESPTWTPDGKHVVFSSNRNDSNPDCLLPPCRLDLYVTRADGSHLRQLTDLPGGAVFFPSVSPDGQTVLFTFVSDAGDTALYTVGIDGTEPRQLSSFAQEYWHGHWSPDGKRIGFSDQGCLSCPASRILTMRADGTDVLQLTFGTKNRTDYNAQWSPDGQWLTFSREVISSFATSDVYVIKADGSQESLLLEKGVNFESTWGPG
jgi:Tol biopolymer transport system component